MSNYNPNLIKIHRNYTVEEMAGVFDIHKNTVLGWIKNGLPCLTERRPYLIMGVDARAYLTAQRVSKKHKCKPNELFCMRCKAPTRPAENWVEYSPISATKGRITGLCSTCECVVNKFIGNRNLAKYQAIFDFTYRRG